ncbi:MULTISPECIES: hypothetical protein [Pseudomonadati]|uniref:Protease n=1 Tax=Shewanella aestuarii TaxID=1028752 RepID=A0ABT0L1E3_9GAMM|nr:hypothetical protein [Shewanella aestuarii]MCL1117510.1 hypothetical protein [Shewanella aestuarii]
MFRVAQPFQFLALLAHILLASMLIFSQNAQGHSDMNEQVTCELTTTPQNGQLQFSMRNSGTNSWQFLSWNTPFDAWFSQFMTITRAGKSVQYQGALAKRGKPQSEDFIQLKPMQTLTVDLDLTQAYMLTPGTYQITISPILLEMLPTNLPDLSPTEQHRDKIQCSTQMFDISYINQ